ncbi:MAG: histidine phosphatase family protein [Myxococcota bacterium]|nr:histidine phosphatase family protein [Myxococcota bacterium]
MQQKAQGSDRTILTLVRHGETPANVEGVWHGSTDSPLTERGHEQAELVAGYLARGRADASALYASPLERTRHTAARIGDALSLEASLEEDLREYHLGDLEGVSYDVLMREHRLFERMREEPDYGPGGGESPRAVAHRFAGALRRIAAAHPGERVVVVAHGGAITLALGLLIDDDVTSWRRSMDNCAVSDLVLEPQPELLTFNECGHSLRPEQLADRVLEFVHREDWVTFAALHKKFAGDAREETEIALAGNRVVWSGLPRPLVDAILMLLDAGRLAAIPGHTSAYKKDGRLLSLPVEKAPPAEAHTTPHWFPVVLRSMETVRSES